AREENVADELALSGEEPPVLASEDRAAHKSRPGRADHRQLLARTFIGNRAAGLHRFSAWRRQRRFAFAPMAVFVHNGEEPRIQPLEIGEGGNMRNGLSALLLTCAVALGGSQEAVAADVSFTLKYGVLAGLTGDPAPSGQGWNEAARLGVEQ